MSPSEAGRLGAAKSKLICAAAKQERIAAYNLDPKPCKQCSGPISYEKKTVNDFCKQSCSAKFNNASRKTTDDKANKEKRRTNQRRTAQLRRAARRCKYCDQLATSCQNIICKRPQLIKSIKKNFDFDLMQYKGSLDIEHKYHEFIDLLQKEYNVASLPILKEKYHYSGDIRNFQKLFKHMGITRKSNTEGLKYFHERIGTYDRKDERELYYLNSQFRFKLSRKIEGFDLIDIHGWYHPITNPHGVSRDHMFSVSEGFKNNIPSDMISHPANCKIMVHTQNASKNFKCSITAEELQRRIDNW